MIEKLKSTVFKSAITFGTYKIIQALSCNIPKILVFHRFDKTGDKERLGSDLFEKQLTEIKNRFNVVPLSAVVSMIKGNSSLIKNAIVITVDDGYHDFYEIAYPLLKKHNLPATIYVTSDFIDKKIWLWPDRISYALNQTTKDKYTLHINDQYQIYDLSSESYYGNLWKVLVDYCLSVENTRKMEFLAEFERELEVELPVLPPQEYSAMSWDELREIADNGIEIGAHTSTHASLSRLTGPELSYEISGCKNKLEGKLGLVVNNFCYPNGTVHDYNNQVMQEVEKAGFLSSTVCFADSVSYTNLYDLRRYSVGSNMYQFHKVIYGIEYLQNKFMKGH